MLVSDPQIAGAPVCGRLRVRCSEHLDLATVITVSQALSGKKLLDTLLFDTNIVGIFLWDFNGRVLQANDAFLRIVGYEREDLVAGRMRWTDITPPDLLDRQAERIREHRTTGSLQPFEKEYFRKDGTRVPVLIGVATLEEETRRRIRARSDRAQARRGRAPGARLVPRVDGPGQPCHAGNERRRADDGRRPRGGARDLRQRPRLAALSVRSRRSFLEAHHGAHAAGVPGRGRPRARFAYDAGKRRGGTGGTCFFGRAPARWLPRAPAERRNRGAFRRALGHADGAPSEGRSAILVRTAPMLARAHVDEGRAAPFRGGRPSAHRRAGEPHRLPRPSRKRSEARGGAAACARGLVGARLRDGPRIPIRRGLPDFRRAAARAAAMARPLAEPHTSRGPGEHRGRERPGAARRSALQRRIPGGAARRCRARGAQPGRRHAGRVRPSRSPVRRDAGHHGVAAGRRRLCARASSATGRSSRRRTTPYSWRTSATRSSRSTSEPARSSAIRARNCST